MSAHDATPGSAVGNGQSGVKRPAKPGRRTRQGEVGPLRDGTEPRPPLIYTAERPMHAVTADALAALVAANDPPSIFQRGGKLCRVRRDERGQPQVEELTEAALRGEVDRAARFVSKEGKPILVRLDYVRDLMALRAWPHLPALDGLVESPVLRPDGSVLTKPGYDESSRLFYAPPPGAPAVSVPRRPSAAERASARELLLELICDFPFVDPASRTGTLAILLTPILRPAIDGHVPLAVLDAPKAGTGKGLIAEVVSLVSTGVVPEVQPAPEQREEWKKLILPVLLSGRTFIQLDEVGVLDAPALAALLTASVYTDRLLGQSKKVGVPNRTVWVACGNNVQLRGDLARRCYWVRLDAKMLRPWERSAWKHPDLLGWVAEHRAELLVACLTLCRAWFAAGKPAAQTPVIGGFDKWAGTVGGVLAYAGIDGFLANLGGMYEKASAEDDEWTVFLVALLAEFGRKPFTTAELMEALNRSALRKALPSALAPKGVWSEVSAQKVGMALRKRDGTVFRDEDGLRLEAGKDEARNVATWRVQTGRATP